MALVEDCRTIRIMLILASASPRRKELLTQAGYDFKVVPANIPEERRLTKIPSPLSRASHRKKRNPSSTNSSAAPPMRTDSLVLGADTIVVTRRRNSRQAPRRRRRRAHVADALRGDPPGHHRRLPHLKRKDTSRRRDDFGHHAGDFGEGNSRLHRHGRADGQSRGLRNPGLRRPLDPSHRGLLFQCRGIATCQGSKHDGRLRFFDGKSAAI